MEGLGLDEPDQPHLSRPWRDSVPRTSGQGEPARTEADQGRSSRGPETRDESKDRPSLMSVEGLCSTEAGDGGVRKAYNSVAGSKACCTAPVRGTGC